MSFVLALNSMFVVAATAFRLSELSLAILMLTPQPIGMQLENTPPFQVTAVIKPLGKCEELACQCG